MRQAPDWTDYPLPILSPLISAFFTSDMYRNIARIHACVEIAHFSTRCIIKAWEVRGQRPSAFQVLMMHQVWKCVISAQAWVLAFIPWLVRNIKEAMWKLRISAHTFSAWIVFWSWDKTSFESYQNGLKTSGVPLEVYQILPNRRIIETVYQTSVYQLLNNFFFQDKYILILPRHSLAKGIVFKKLKHGSFITNWWNIHWSVPVQFLLMYTSGDISTPIKVAQ